MEQNQKQQTTSKKPQRYTFPITEYMFHTFDSQHMIFTQAIIPFPSIFYSTQFHSLNKAQLNNPFLSFLTSHTK